MKNKIDKNLKTVIIIALIISAFFGYDYYFNKKPLITIEPIIKKQTKTEQEIEKIKWSTFRNEKFGYEIKYPQGAEIRKINNDQAIQINFKDIVFSSVKQVIKKNDSNESELRKSDLLFIVGIEVFSKRVHQSISSAKEWFDQEGRDRFIKYTLPSLEKEIIINDLPTYYVEYKLLDNYTDIMIHFWKNERVFVLVGRKVSNEQFFTNDPYIPYAKQYFDIFNSMVKSFKFIDEKRK